jgi:hypothetical protein
VADEAWLSRVRTGTGAEPFLDDDGAVVIPVTSGSGPVLQGAPPDRTIKLPALGAHQARVTVALGTSTLRRVIIDAHERLEEVLLDRSGGRIADLTINASRDDWALKLLLRRAVESGRDTVQLRGELAVGIVEVACLPRQAPASPRVPEPASHVRYGSPTRSATGSIAGAPSGAAGDEDPVAIQVEHLAGGLGSTLNACRFAL